MKAVENSATIIGLRCLDGVVLASEKLIASELHVKGDNSRIFKVCEIKPFISTFSQNYFFIGKLTSSQTKLCTNDCWFEFSFTVLFL